MQLQQDVKKDDEYSQQSCSENTSKQVWESPEVTILPVPDLTKSGGKSTGTENTPFYSS